MMQCVMLSNYPVSRAELPSRPVSSVRWLRPPGEGQLWDPPCKYKCEIPPANTERQIQIQIQAYASCDTHLLRIEVRSTPDSKKGGKIWQLRREKYGKYEGSFKRSSFLSKEVNLKEGVRMSAVKRERCKTVQGAGHIVWNTFMEWV